MNNQVISLELATKLKELGVKQDSIWYWVQFPLSPEYILGLRTFKGCLVNSSDDNGGSYITGGDPISAFTVAELGALLPELCLSGKASSKYYNCWWMETMLGPIKHYNSCQSVKEADARALMLIWLIEQGKV